MFHREVGEKINLLLKLSNGLHERARAHTHTQILSLFFFDGRKDDEFFETRDEKFSY